VIYLIDASVYVFRAYHSRPADVLDQDGNPAHAVYGFARFLCDLLERVRPTYIVVAFDQTRGGSFRNRIYPPYKAHRERPPADLALQFERCFEFCDHIGVTAVGSSEYEADDIIGSVSCLMRREGIRSTLVTRDKDLAQLVREGDVLWDYSSGSPIGYPHIERRFGVTPERFADYLALTGDAVDNIPGVPGIGPKTAASLMRAFASLEEMYDDLERVSKLKFRGAAAIGSRLREHRETAFLARRLTLIACDMPLKLQAQHLRRKLPDAHAVSRFCDRHNLGPLLRRQTERLAELPFG
jgi:DNA polymerase I